MSADLPYRPCAGVVLTNADGRIFAGQRAGIDTPAWQMPQGGLDEGEDPVDAAYRELEEETGVGRDHVTFIGKTSDWLTYDFPPELALGRWKDKYRGQAQMWVHVRLDAPDSVINLNHKDVEFSDWRWMTKREILTVIVPFKRGIYKAVLKELGI
ncbi:RNA pyrophosphohydrolase [Rhodobacteraceae bacterium M385]|nr:RNA pyrophosphohydrolase [Rhodobacteraceae bacterium M385]